VIARRRMVRNYDPDRPVPAPARDRLLRAAQRAPSAGFTQGTEFLVLESPADRETFWAATTPAVHEAPPEPPAPPAALASADQSTAIPAGRWLAGMRRAPLLVVCFSHRQAYADRYGEPDKHEDDIDTRWQVPYWHIDTGFTALMMLLDAVDQGLGACFFGVPTNRVGALRDAFGVPGGYTPVGVVSVGYPAPDHRPASLHRPRRGVADVAHLGHWSRR